METPLKDLLINRINATGAITIADYMADCLMHPKHGYYQQERVFGKDGDFVTSPEISAMFGEMVTVWLMDRWRSLGRPNPVNIIELGPGRGTLMQDILQTAPADPQFKEAIKVYFLESSQQLRAEQASKIPDATWLDSMNDLPQGPTLFIANEFFDALPIHQFVKKDGMWFEKRVAVVDGDLSFMRTPASSISSLIPEGLIDTASNGSIAEVCPSALSITGLMAEHISQNDGAALIIDYGYKDSAVGETFQALKAHTYVDPLLEPGKADLTAHVDFEQISKVAIEKGLTVSSVIGQGPFLMALGMGNRAMQLATEMSEDEQNSLLADLQRLTAPKEMGSLFKAVSFQSSQLDSPPGFG